MCIVGHTPGPGVGTTEMDHLRTDVTVAHALCWQINSGNKWRKTDKIHRRGKKCLVPLECKKKMVEDVFRSEKYVFKSLSEWTVLMKSVTITLPLKHEFEIFTY